MDSDFLNPTPWDKVKSFVETRKLATALTAAGIVALIGLIYFIVITRDLPSLNQLENYKPKLASKVYSADLKIIHEYFEEKRSFIPLEEMPDALLKAVIATEDRRFYDHWGMNLRRFAQAAVINVTSFRFKQGASTLTQQLARQLYLTLDKTITRKIKEMITAIQIERTYTKDEILEMYLNHMNFGHGAYGVQSASLKYFGKDASELTTDESAMLIGLLPAPAFYTPLRHPERALFRRNIVLASMREMKFLNEEEYTEMVNKPIDVMDYNTASTAYGLAPYFTEYIRQILQEKYGYNLYTDGLSIYTTLDSRAQACAERAVQDQLKELQLRMHEVYSKKKAFVDLMGEEFFKEINVDALLKNKTLVDSLIDARAPVQAALISLDPRNGHILAWVGGRDFTESKYNRVVQARRQPGSAFKPFVYTVAIDNGYPTTYEVLNQPVVLMLENGERWSPQNYDLSIGGPTTFREGLRRSLNLVTVRVLQSVIQKPSLVVEYARKMGIRSPLQAVDALALGASDVTPLEITSAFGVFANGGVRVEPFGILRVEDANGNIIEQNSPVSQEVLRKETAYIMTDLLKTVVNNGTGASARSRYNFYRAAGGKTGTTNDFSDAWFIGFTPQIVTGVWTGFDDFRLNLGKGSDGAKAALPIWAPYMKCAHDTLGLPEADFPMPDGVVRLEVCGDSKKLATDFCPNILNEVFEARYAPTERCEQHGGMTRDNRNKREKNKERVRF